MHTADLCKRSQNISEKRCVMLSGRNFKIVVRAMHVYYLERERD